MGDDCDRFLLSHCLHQVQDVEGVLCNQVFRRFGPFAVSMASQVRSNHMVRIAKDPCSPVPVATVISSPVDHDQQGFFLIPPVDIMKPEPLGKIVIGAGPKHRLNCGGGRGCEVIRDGMEP